MSSLDDKKHGCIPRQSKFYGGHHSWYFPQISSVSESFAILDLICLFRYSYTPDLTKCDTGDNQNADAFSSVRFVIFLFCVSCLIMSMSICIEINNETIHTLVCVCGKRTLTIHGNKYRLGRTHEEKTRPCAQYTMYIAIRNITIYIIM